jgi:hypothetical protein
MQTTVKKYTKLIWWFFTEVHLVATKLVLIVAIHPLDGSRANWHSKAKPSTGAAHPTQDGDPPSHEQSTRVANYDLPRGRLKNPSQSFSGASYNLLTSFDGATKPSRRWQPLRVTSTTGLQQEHLVPLDATSRCNHTRITHSLIDSQSSKHKVSWRLLKPSTHKGNTSPRCLAPAKADHYFYL